MDLRSINYGGRQATAALFSLCHKAILLTLVAVTGSFLGGDDAAAEQLVFKADDEILVVRGRQTMDYAIFEILGPRDGGIQCVAVGADGNLIAVTNGYAEVSAIMFQKINVTDIAKVSCRYLE
ncbi:MAG: hypothetical protein NTW20_14220 [Rhodobacterales bacterium]|nr:hypothetical protein [Rhodobacterales bacterium]